MRTLLLSSLSIIGGFTTVHAQHWVPYGFYSYKTDTEQAAQEQTEEQSLTLEVIEPVLAEGQDTEVYSDADIYYANPELAYTPIEGGSAQKTPSRGSRLCAEQFWLQGEYLLAWLKEERINVPLITTGSAADAVPGAIGQPHTTVVFGDQKINYHRIQGVRGGIGAYLNQNKTFSVDVDGFWIFSKTKHFKISSDVTGNPLIARPFFDTRDGVEDAEVISFPGSFNGSSSALVKSQFWGMEANIGTRPCRGMVLSDFFVGFRFLRLHEKIAINDTSSVISTGEGTTSLFFNSLTLALGDTLTDEDEFRTDNKFYGGQLGLRVEFSNYWLSLMMLGKVGLGSTEEIYTTEGETTWNSTTFGKQQAVGGVLVQPGNIVKRTKTRFGLVPEANITLGLGPIYGLRFLVGYTFLWWNKVIRPGKQIDRNVNSGDIPRDLSFFTAALPTKRQDFSQSSFYMQALSLGVSFDF